MDIKIGVNDLQKAISDILTEYGDYVYKLTEEGLAEAEKVLIQAEKDASPVGTGEYKKSWKGSGKKYKLSRYVGNVKTVKGKSGDIPLANILEYSAKSKHQGKIKRTYNAAVPEMAKAIVNKIKEG